MSDLGTIFHVKKNGIQYDAHVYTTLDECPEPNIKLIYKGQRAYIKLAAKGEGDMPCYVRNKTGNLYQVLSTPLVEKKQIIVVHGAPPWYNTNWGDKDKIINIDTSVAGIATITCKGVTRLDNTFAYCSNLTSIDFSNFDFSNVDNLYSTFESCSSLMTIDLSNCDTSKVWVMSYTFANCKYLSTIKGVIDMKSCDTYPTIFGNCNSLQGVKIRNPPSDFTGGGLNSNQYTIVP